MADRFRFRLSLLTRAALLIALGSLSLPTTLAWQTRSSIGDSAQEFPVAFEGNARGEISELYRNDNDQVFLRITLASGFIKFSPSNCPTLQIDRRVPVHHYETGPACTLTTDSVNILLADIQDNMAVSLPLHRLMNGSQLAVRYVTSSGEYRESIFTLNNSKQAIKAAIGNEVRVEPRIASTDEDPDNDAMPSATLIP